MPATPSAAQSDASCQSGARPASAAGKARSALNGVRHGLCGRTFFLLADEDPAEFRAHEAMWLAAWSPRDLHEHAAAAAAIRAMWREMRADRLEVQVLTDLFAAGEIADAGERQAVKAAAMKALATLLRYQGRIEREHRAAIQALELLRQRRLAEPRPSEPEPAPPAAGPAARPAVTIPPMPTIVRTAGLPTNVASPPPAAAQPIEPEPYRALNRHQRRALAAVARRAA